MQVARGVNTIRTRFEVEVPTPSIPTSSKKDLVNKWLARASISLQKFLSWRWMGLFLGPAYGFFIYLYVTHLVLSGSPFTISSGVSLENNILDTFKNQGLNTTAVGNGPKTTSEFVPLMTKETSHKIGGGIGMSAGISLSLSSIFSRRVRCSMVLVVPSMVTKRGRGFMLTLMTSLLIEGPISTIKYNLQEVVRSFTCMYEEIKTLADRFSSVFQELMGQVRGIMQKMEDLVQKYQRQMEILLKEATGDTKEQIKRAKEDLDKQAREIKEAASKVKDVLNAPSKFFSDTCKGASAIGGSIGSWVKGAAKDVGNWFKNPFGRKKRSTSSIHRSKRACGVPNIVNIPGINVPDIGVEKLTNILKSLKPDLNIVDFDFDNLIGKIDSSSIKNIREKLKGLFNSAIEFAKLVANWWSKIFYLSILFVMFDAMTYQKKYYTDDEFDNMMVDENLKKVWKNEGLKKLTPLRKWEIKNRFQVSSSIKLSKAEVKRIILESLPSIIMTVIIISIVVVDYCFTFVLQAFQDNAKFGLSFPGMEQGISFDSMIRGADAKVDILKIEAFDLRTDPCLPKAKQTPASYLGPIFTIMLFCLVSCLMDAYASRLRAMICNMFYTARATERAQFLYR